MRWKLRKDIRNFYKVTWTKFVLSQKRPSTKYFLEDIQIDKWHIIEKILLPPTHHISSIEAQIRIRGAQGEPREIACLIRSPYQPKFALSIKFLLKKFKPGASFEAIVFKKLLNKVHFWVILENIARTDSVFMLLFGLN